jgi:hypothetical protein
LVLFGVHICLDSQLSYFFVWIFFIKRTEHLLYIRILNTDQLLLHPTAQCILFFVVFTPSPPATTAVFGSYLLVGPKKKTTVGLLEFNPLWLNRIQCGSEMVLKSLVSHRLSVAVAHESWRNRH